MPKKMTLEGRVARCIAPEWFIGPDDQSSPTERELYAEHSPRKQEEARLKARRIIQLVNNQR